MDKPTLDWFSQLTTGHPAAPDAVRVLGQSVKQALLNKHLNKAVNRAFARHKSAVAESLVWLNSLSGQIAQKSCNLTTKAWEGSIAALQLISDNGIPSECWGLQMQRGRQAGFSKTLEAAALANHIQRNPEIHYTKTEAVEIAAHIIGVNAREVWDFSDITPINAASEDAMAAFGIVKNNRVHVADRYLDVEELFNLNNSSDRPD